MKHSRTQQLLASVVLCLVAPTLARADDAAVAYNRAVSAVVSVACTKANGEILTGTGVVTASGIVTARHVVPSEECMVVVIFPARDDSGAVIAESLHYADRKHFKLCKVVGTSGDRDLTLLRLVEPQRSAVIPMAQKSASPGEQVFSIGAAVGPGMFHYVGGSVRQVFHGTYSMRGGDEVKSRLIQTSIALNPGDSGGPILNKDGNLLGIISATDPTSNQVHLGIDVSEVKAFLDEIRRAELLELIKRRDAANARLE